MRLEIDPSAHLGILSTDLDLVIDVIESGLPSIHVDRGQPPPDRHLLLGLAQCAAVATAERDRESVRFLEPCAVTLVRGTDRLVMGGPLIIMRNSHGEFGVLSLADAETTRRLTRRLVRQFTGAIRLDVP
jgi:hypothetical protein